MKLNLEFILFFIVVPLYLQGTITESSTITSILPILEANKNKKIVIALDLDNTLIKSVTALGSPEFASARKTHMEAQGITPDDAFNTMLNDFAYIAHHDSFELVEKESIMLLNHLAASNIPFLGLTGRAMNISQCTLDKLHFLNIRFNFFIDKNIFLYLPFIACYTKGILFCDMHNPKEDVLVKFFETINYKPDLLIYCDDGIKYLEAMQDAMNKLGIAFEGIRINACDEAAKQLDFEKTENKFQELKKSMQQI